MNRESGDPPTGGKPGAVPAAVISDIAGNYPLSAGWRMGRSLRKSKPEDLPFSKNAFGNKSDGSKPEVLFPHV